MGRPSGSRSDGRLSDRQIGSPTARPKVVCEGRVEVDWEVTSPSARTKALWEEPAPGASRKVGSLTAGMKVSWKRPLGGGWKVASPTAATMSAEGEAASGARRKMGSPRVLQASVLGSIVAKRFGSGRIASTPCLHNSRFGRRFVGSAGDKFRGL